MTTALTRTEPKAAAQATAAPAELLPRVVRNMFWLLNSNLLVRVLSLLRGIILARLLLPDDFGLFGLASVVIGFTAMFGDVGAGVFLVYREDDVEQHRDTAFWTNLGIATLLAVAVAATAPLVALIYGRADVTPVLLVLAASLWFYLASTVHRNLLRRDLRFRALAVIDGGANVASFIVAVALALSGGGVWAFVVAHLIGNLISAIFCARASGWVPRGAFSRESLKALAPFSGWYLGQAVVWYIVLNLDNLLVGKFLGIETLGIYGLAYNYALLPVTVIAGTLGNVVFAELPRLYSNPPLFWASFFRLSRLLVGGVAPVAAAMVVSAPDIFPLLFGPKWNGAIVPFQILAVYAVVRCLWIDPFVALGRFQASCWTAMIGGFACFVGVYLALPFGTVAVAWAVLLTVGGLHAITLYVATRSIEQVLHGLRNAFPFVAVAAVATLLAAFVRHGLVLAGASRKEWLVLSSVSTVFLPYAFVFRRQLGELCSLLLRARKSIRA